MDGGVPTAGTASSTRWAVTTRVEAGGRRGGRRQRSTEHGRAEAAGPRRWAVPCPPHAPGGYRAEGCHGRGDVAGGGPRGSWRFQGHRRAVESHAGSRRGNGGGGGSWPAQTHPLLPEASPEDAFRQCAAALSREACCPGRHAHAAGQQHRCCVLQHRGGGGAGAGFRE